MKNIKNQVAALMNDLARRDIPVIEIYRIIREYDSPNLLRLDPKYATEVFYRLLDLKLKYFLK